MTYAKREDGRKFDELRPMEAKVGVIPRADGSAMFKIGKTIAYAAVYGPKALHPTHLRNPETGIIRCNYNMMSFSGSGDRIRPGPSRRSKEINLVMAKALSPVMDLSDYPNTVVDVFVELLQTDAGTRCAGITAASLALADAGIAMKDLVVAFAVGKVGDKVVVDLDYSEESFEEGATDIPIAVMPRTGKLTLLQLDGDITREEIKEALEKSKKAVKQLYDVQKEALKAKYEEK
ncbi:MAG: exosome complex exonuclease Rrp41 [Nanoarchaeota archaeon]|nr:exosome complex exonuclease Rrp41 [Nanoarchaeota archaeon]MCG2717220.1 exosome complex exonuclease Rrp41 [Nanoarchaeota archaeon]